MAYRGFRAFRALAALLLPVAAAHADVISYEASSALPEREGWQRIVWCTPERWLEDGWLHQDVDPAGECFDPPAGDRDAYTRSIAEFDGAATFFIEWRMEADGDASEFTWVGPADLTAGTQGPVFYGFTIARDLVRFQRDSHLETTYAPIEPGVPHTHRLELYGDQLFAWYIDGIMVHSGLPGGTYPATNPNINWLATSAYLQSHVEWDYIRFGTIPEDGSGDFNGDGAVDFEEFYFFQECISDPQAGSWPGCAWADFDFDGGVDCDDWLAFQLAWTEAADPPCLAQCDCCADLDGDGTVGFSDLTSLLASWGPQNPGHPADFDNDLNVGFADLVELLALWGPCS